MIPMFIPALHHSTPSPYLQFTHVEPRTEELIAAVTHSAVLSTLQKKFYLQMIHCVAQFGIANDRELFNAAGYCFDMNFGPDYPHNMITLQDYLAVMGDEVKATLGEIDYIDAQSFAHDRPGFFLLTPTRTIHFLKEETSGSLVVYNPQTDAFEDSAALPVTGQDKLVVLNKSSHPKPAAFFDIPTPDHSANGKFYHPMQEERKCAIHAAHAFIGFPAIDETVLSLLKLEMATDLTYSSEMPEDRWEMDPSLLPQGQIKHYKNRARFKFAQTSFYQAELGNNQQEVILILKLMAETGTIDKKYGDARTYGLNVCDVAMTYAKENGLYSEDQACDEGFILAVLEAVNGDLAKDKTTLDALDQKIREMELLAVSLGLGRGFISVPHFQLIEERHPYDMLEGVKKRLTTSLQGIRELHKEFERSDRLLVLSDTEDHCFTLRKREDGMWVVLDSLEPEQIATAEPLKWLSERRKKFLQATERCTYDFITLSK